MHHAILIICHKVTNALLYTLDEISNDSNTKAFIHVDKKISLDEFSFIKKYKNCVLLEQRQFVSWGSSSQIFCTLNCMNYIFENYQFDYFSLISGDDIFHRTLNKMNNYLANNMGVNFIGVSDFSGVSEQDAYKFLYRYNQLFYNRRTSFYFRLCRRVVKKLFLFGFFRNKQEQPFEVMYKGSNWFTLTYSAIEHILKFCENNVLYQKYFDQSFCCDEIFFVSIIFNSPIHKSTLAYLQNNTNDNLMSLRKIDWDSGPMYPKVYCEEDIKHLCLDDTFILRKIDANISVERIKILISELNENE